MVHYRIGSFRLVVFSAMALTLLAATSVYAQPTVVSAYNDHLRKLPRERLEFYNALAKHYAPRFFVETELSKVSTGDRPSLYAMRPQDLIVSPYFDGDKDLRNNKKNIEGMNLDKPISFPMSSEVPFFVRETLTHYFLRYIKYNAVDDGLLGHAHDAETVWMAIRKDDHRFGSLEVWALNRHAMPLLYSFNPELESRMRQNFEIGKEDGTIRTSINAAMADWYDKSGLKFDKTWRSMDEQTRRNTFGNQLPVFVSKKKHALSICIPTNVDSASTCAFVCKPEGANVTHCFSLSSNNLPTLSYSVMNFDDEIQGLGSNEQALIFHSSKTPATGRHSSPLGEFESIGGQPKGFESATEEPEANFDWDLRISGAKYYELDHEVLKYLMKDPVTKETPSEANISSVYLFNPHLKLADLNLEVLLQSVQPCLTNSWSSEFNAVINASEGSSGR